MRNLVRYTYILILIQALIGCGGGSSNDLSSTHMHEELQIVDPATMGSSQSSGMVGTQALVSIGSVYLETQLAPVTVSGTSLQASDVSTYGLDSYVSYSAYDTGGVVTKKGAVQHVNSFTCDNVLTTRTEYCLGAASTLAFPDADIFASVSDGTNLYVTGSTSSEDQSPMYARVYKVGLSATKDPTSVSVTTALESYAGTGITKIGSNIMVTSGTSVDASKMGGVNVLDSNLTFQNKIALYDARAVSADPSSAAKMWVTRGAISTSNQGAVLSYAAAGTGSALQTYGSTGNNIAESKSSVQIGNQLILASMGDQGFRVMCKATGASLATVAAPTVSGIASNLTVTNAVLAIPGYILAANGEAGLYVYQFQKSSVFQSSSNLCAGVTVTLVGRLTLASGGYINGALSANSLSYVKVFNLLNVLTAKLIVVGSGNKGTSLLNLSGLTVDLFGVDIDDFP